MQRYLGGLKTYMQWLETHRERVAAAQNKAAQKKQHQRRKAARSSSHTFRTRATRPAPAYTARIAVTR
jgi:hypothetical protein